MGLRFEKRVVTRVALVVLIAASGWTSALTAQVGTTTDILTGTVRGPDRNPIAGATVTARSIETQISRSRQTDTRGRYTIVFPDGGGAYQLTVRFLGMAPRTLNISRQADEDQLITDINMGAIAQQLGPVVVRAAPRGNANDRPTPGSVEKNFTPDQVARLPIADASDLAALAALVPGVVGLTGTDSTATSFSVAGQRPDQNNVTLDGISFGAASIPQDAVRSTRVITSTYDAARGQFSGGQIASTTRSGTNVVQGSFTYQLRDPSLDVTTDPEAGSFGRGYLQNTLSGGLGGPLITDKLFVFGAFQVRRRVNPLTSFTVADPATLQRLGVSPDSVAAFLAKLSSSGVSATLPIIPNDSRNDNLQLFFRTDYSLGDMHTVMLRADYRQTDVIATRIGTYAVPSYGGTQTQRGGGLMAMLTSHFVADRGSLINEVRGYRSTGAQNSDPYLSLPSGRVQILSTLTDGTVGASVLQFGGNSGLPQESGNVGFEGTDEVSFIPTGSTHRFKLGFLVNTSDFNQTASFNQLGTFTFSSLSAFESNQPSMYTRTLAPQRRQGGSTNAAVYLGDTWRTVPSLQLTYGVRVEGSRYSGAPAFNPAIDTLFGYRTSDFPSEVHASPRLGFTWTGGLPTRDTTGAQRGRGGAGEGGGRNFFQGFGPAVTIVRGGVGEFRGLAPSQLFSAAQTGSGLATTASQLVCVGPSVPVPDFAGFAQFPEDIPTHCLGGSSPGPADGLLRSRPNVTVFDPSFQAPRSWRASLGVQHRFLDMFTVSVDANYALGLGQYGFRDLNLDTTHPFLLASEGNRPVYVPAASIDPLTGTITSFASRLHPQFGQMVAVTSDLRSDTRQLTVGVGGQTSRGLQFQTSYTFTRSRDQSSFPGAFGGAGVGANTAGDPNVAQWATSDLERRHSIIVTGSYPTTSWLELTAIGRMVSGSPFTPVVGSDINGDGLRDDRAFVFDPARASDTAVANAMQRVISSSSGSVRDCLRSSLGAVASRNSCVGPWAPSLDLQANLRPTFMGLDWRLTLSIGTVNMLAGVDQLVHGSNNLAGWGAPVRPDPTLLYVKGFGVDAANQPRFVYQVNERFGRTNGSANAFRAPFQLTFQGRITVGPDPVRERLQRIFGIGGTRGDSGQGFSDRFSRMVPNLVDSIAALGDSLNLTPAQQTRLKAISDSLSAKNKVVATDLTEQVKSAGAAPDPRALFAKLTPRIAEARANVATALQAVQATLTPEQWAKVPDRLKKPQQGGGFGRGGGGGRPPGA